MELYNNGLDAFEAWRGRVTAWAWNLTFKQGIACLVALVAIPAVVVYEVDSYFSTNAGIFVLLTFTTGMHLLCILSDERQRKIKRQRESEEFQAKINSLYGGRNVTVLHHDKLPGE